jgi:hypothetical protein
VRGGGVVGARLVVAPMRLPGRRAHRTDANQAEIVDGLRKFGCLVTPVGHPFDVLVGHRGRWIACEIKDGQKPPSERRLTDDEETFRDQCVAKGLPYALITSWEDAELALRLLGVR